ncbi:MAG: AAA family ATPase, partial [Actinomycetota bacterium]
MTGNDRVTPRRTGVPDVTWPLTGRAAELERVTARLGNRQGAIVLAGPAGVGKTRLGVECLAIAAAHGFVPLRVAATQGAAGLPFGAFAHLVPELAPTSDRLEVLRQIARAVGAAGNGKLVAVFIDDVHLLDESSAALTHLLATKDGVFVLATLRSGESAPDPIVALWKDGLAERLELRPLGLHDAGDLLVAALGGPVDGGAVQVLQTRTEGNVLFLREVVLGALDAGVLRREEGVWRLGGLPPASSRLVEIIEARLGHLEEPVAAALGVLALSEPLEVDLLHVVDPVIDLQALERRGLMRVEQQGRRLAARLPHPLYAEVLRARLSPLRARDSARALAIALQSTGARRREDTLRLAMWSLDGGSSLDPGVMLAAATTARQRFDFPLAERLARSAVGAGAGFEAGLLLAQVCWLQGRAAEAMDQLGTLEGSATTDAERTLLVMARISVLDWGLKQTDAALRVAEEAELTIADPGCRDQVTAERARILGRSGRNGAAVTIAAPLLDRVTGSALVSTCFAAGTSMCVTGQFTAGMAATERGLAAHLQLEGPPLPFGPYLHLVIRSKLLLGAGRIPDAVALARTEYEKAVAEGSIEAQSFFSFELAHALLSEGRVATAERIAAESAGAFRELRWSLWVRNALAARAYALALLGHASAARAVLSELDALGVPPAELLGPEVLQARGWTEVAAGDLVAARIRLEEAAAMARWSGGYALESAALHDLARLGRAEETASRLRELTGVVEGDFAPARAHHAAALATQDAAGLDAASVAFEGCGAVLLAAEAAADAATAWRRRGEPRRATASERRSRALGTGCEGARTPSLATPTPAGAALTTRELEIAR